MDLQNVNTPGDLARENAQPTAEDKVVDLIMELGIQSGHAIVLRCVEAAIDLHKERVHEMVTSDEKVDPVDIVLWTKDLEKLVQAKQMLDEVEV